MDRGINWEKDVFEIEKDNCKIGVGGTLWGTLLTEKGGHND